MFEHGRVIAGATTTSTRSIPCSTIRIQNRDVAVQSTKNRVGITQRTGFAVLQLIHEQVVRTIVDFVR